MTPDEREALVERMLEAMCAPDGVLRNVRDGLRRALAAVRASAVGVDHIAEVSKMVIAESPHD